MLKFLNRRTGLFFGITGIFLIVFSVFAFISVNKIKNYIKTEAVVTNAEIYEQAYTDSDDTFHEATYTVFVKYTVDGKEYEEEYGVFSEYKEGDKVTICYNPDNPKEIAQPNTNLLPTVILILGIISVAAGVLGFLRG